MLGLVFMSFIGCASNHNVVANMTLNAANYLNPDVYGKAAPIMVTFYQIKTPMGFQAANYFNLTTKPQSVLQDNLVDKHTVEVRPGESINYKMTMPKSVRYIGVVAGYRNINQAQWKHLVLLSPDKEYSSISVNLTTQDLSVTLNNNKEPWL